MRRTLLVTLSLLLLSVVCTKEIPSNIRYKSAIRRLNLKYVEDNLDLSRYTNPNFTTNYGSVEEETQDIIFRVTSDLKGAETLNVDSEELMLSVVGYLDGYCSTTIYQNVTKAWNATFALSRPNCNNIKFNWIRSYNSSYDQASLKEENLGLGNGTVSTLMSYIDENGDFFWFKIEDVEQTVFTKFNKVETGFYESGYLMRNELYDVKFLGGLDSNKNARIFVYQRTDNSTGSYPDVPIAFLTSRNKNIRNGDELRLINGTLKLNNLHSSFQDVKLKNIIFRNDARTERPNFGIFTSHEDVFGDVNLFYLRGDMNRFWHRSEIEENAVYIKSSMFRVFGHCHERISGMKYFSMYDGSGTIQLCEPSYNYPDIGYRDINRLEDLTYSCIKKVLRRDPREVKMFLDKSYSTQGGIVVSKFRKRGDPNYQYYSVDSFLNKTIPSGLDYENNFYTATKYFLFEIPKRFNNSAFEDLEITNFNEASGFDLTNYTFVNRNSTSNSSRNVSWPVESSYNNEFEIEVNWDRKSIYNIDFRTHFDQFYTYLNTRAYFYLNESQAGQIITDYSTYPRSSDMYELGQTVGSDVRGDEIDLTNSTDFNNQTWFAFTSVRVGSYIAPRNTLKNLFSSQKKEQEFKQQPRPSHRVERVAETDNFFLFQNGSKLHSFSYMGPKGSWSRNEIDDEQYLTFDLEYLNINTNGTILTFSNSTNLTANNFGPPMTAQTELVLIKNGMFWFAIFFRPMSPGEFHVRKFFSPVDLEMFDGSSCYCSDYDCHLSKAGVGIVTVSRYYVYPIIKAPEYNYYPIRWTKRIFNRDIDILIKFDKNDMTQTA